jgi:hypothetical protein
VFACWTPEQHVVVAPAGNARIMPAEVFTLIGLAAVALLGIARWWEEH